MHTDPIADLLTRLKNAQKARKESLEIPYSRPKEEILKVLVAKEYVKSFKVVKDGKFSVLKAELNLKIPQLNLKRVSKPGQRIYSKSKEIKPVLRGIGHAIVSTPKGIMTDQEARRNKVGGEVLFEVY